MKLKYLSAFLAFAIVAESSFSLQALADSKNPYVEIYAARAEIAKLEIERQDFLVAKEQKVLERLRPLVANGIISRQQFGSQEVILQKARVVRSNLQVKTAQAQALSRVNSLRIDNGLEVSICPEGD